MRNKVPCHALNHSSSSSNNNNNYKRANHDRILLLLTGTHIGVARRVGHVVDEVDDELVDELQVYLGDGVAEDFLVREAGEAKRQRRPRPHREPQELADEAVHFQVQRARSGGVGHEPM